MKCRLPIVALLTALVLSACLVNRHAVADETENASARQYNAAAALQNAGLHQRAAEKWSEFITQHPDDERVGRASYYLSVCHLRQRKFDEAANQFRAVLDRWPDLAQADKAQYNLALARYEIALAEKNADKFRQAADEFALLVSKYNQSDFVDDALFYQSDSRFNAGDIEAVIEPLTQLIRKHGTSQHAARAFYDLGTAQQELGKRSEAIATFREFLNKPEYASHELTAEIRLRLAVCLYDEGQRKESIEQFGKAANERDFELADYALFRMGQAQFQDDHFKLAAETLKDFEKKHPNSDYRNDALTTAGKAFFWADNPNEAVRILTPVAQGKEPPAGEAAYWLGRSLIKQNQFPRAVSEIDNAIARLPSDPFLSYLKFARIDAIYEIKERRKEASPLYEQFMRDYPEHEFAAQANYMAAAAAFGEKSFAKSRELAAAFLANSKHASSVLVPELMFIAAESTLLESPDAEPARANSETLYRELIGKFPDHERVSQSQLRVGWCLNATKKSQEAIEWLKPLLGKFDKQTQLPEANALIGQSHQRLGQHREAVAAFEQVIKQHGDWKRLDEILADAAASYRELKEWPKARAHLEYLVNSFPQSVFRAESMYGLGSVLQEQDDANGAMNWFRQTGEQYANTEFGAPAIQTLASLHLNRKEFNEARDWSTRVIAGNASNEWKVKAKYVRGIAYQSLQDFLKAIDDLNAVRGASKDNDEQAGVLYALVLCHVGAGQLQPAQDRLKELAETVPEYPALDRAYYEVAHALRKNPDSKLVAIEAFEWIIQKRPKSELASESAFRIAQYHVESSTLVQDEAEKKAALATAEQVLQSGLAGTPTETMKQNLLYLLGDVFYQQQNFQNAAVTLQEYADKFPEGKYRGSAVFLAARSYAQVGKFESALPMFDKVADARFDDTAEEQIEAFRSQALYHAGECAAQLKRWNESQDRFTRLADQYAKFPQRDEALFGVAVAQQQQSQTDAAIQSFDRVTKEYETEAAAKARFMIGEIHFGNKRYEDAIEQFLIVSVGYPYQHWQALARFETARCFVELGDKSRANKTLEEMIEKHSEHARIEDAKRMMRTLIP